MTLASATPEIFKGMYNLKLGHMTLTTPLSGKVVTNRLGHAIINLPTKFEVPNFTCYGNMKGDAKCRKWGVLGWLGVTLAYRQCHH